MFAQKNKIPNPRDRFIPLRLSQNAHLENDGNSDHPDLCCETFTNFAKKRYHSQHYRKALKSVLMPFDSKILNFFPPKDEENEEDSSQSSKNWRWPVKRRKRPVLEAPRLVLDLPQIELDGFHNLADWGNNNKLIVIFTGEVHIWTGLFAETMDLQGRVSRTSHRAQLCVKWNKIGTHFAVSLLPNKLGIYDVQTNKIIHESECCSGCHVICMDWVNDDFLLTGCSFGVLKSRTFDLREIVNVVGHEGAILSVKASCKGKYAATCAYDRFIKIWLLSDMSVLCALHLPHIACRAMAWHPWREPYLATGYKNQLIVWKVSEYDEEFEIVDRKTFPKRSEIDAITFNPISGELVLSYYMIGSGGFGLLTVNPNLATVSEELFIKKERIMYLLWGDGGRTLGAAGSKENLYLWDFFGTDNIKKKIKNIKKNKFTTNSLHNLNAFNTYLR